MQGLKELQRQTKDHIEENIRMQEQLSKAIIVLERDILSLRSVQTKNSYAPNGRFIFKITGYVGKYSLQDIVSEPCGFSVEVRDNIEENVISDRQITKLRIDLVERSLELKLLLSNLKRMEV